MVDQSSTGQQGQTSRAFSQLGTDTSRAEFNVPPAVLSSKLTDGGDYIVISRTRQGEEPKIWSSGDQQQAQHLFDAFTRSMNLQPTT